MAGQIGLIVNPVAGLGGRVGLHGSDGESALREAVRRGATPWSPLRATQALSLLRGRPGIALATYAGEMGEDAARAAGLEPQVLGRIRPGRTGPDDTRRAARELVALGVDLLLFAGGDGTARDVHTAIGLGPLTLGIPAGVKLHSGVFATTPHDAGRLALEVAAGRLQAVREGEVMDIDETAYREGRVEARLYGYLAVPAAAEGLQSVKSGAETDESSLAGIARDVAARIAADARLWLIGPGTTTRAVLARLGLAGSLLGVDAVQGGRLLLTDAREEELLELLDGRAAGLVLGVIGGQGYLLGRGNQQLSPAVLRRIERAAILVAATPGKLVALGGRPLLVDTGDDALDRSLQGYWRVTTGHRTQVLYRVAG